MNKQRDHIARAVEIQKETGCSTLESIDREQKEFDMMPATDRERALADYWYAKGRKELLMEQKLDAMPERTVEIKFK